LHSCREGFPVLNKFKIIRRGRSGIPGCPFFCLAKDPSLAYADNATWNLLLINIFGIKVSCV
jgi:hypothetical protein